MSEAKRTCRCPKDSARIPLVEEFRNWPGPVVRFYWCHWCKLLFAVVGENDYGGRDAASLAYEQEEKRFVLRGAWGEPKDVELVKEVLAKITFSPQVGDGK